jgi:predicted phosphate transport protein (TIGR00153 family)
MGKNPISRLFGRSPFKPLQEHIRIVVKCGGEVINLFEALGSGEHAKLVAVKDQIFELEHEADSVKNELRAHLPKSLMMPVDRRDLLEILDLQDSIADTAQDIARILSERPMEIPEGMRSPLMALIRRSAEACDHARRIVENMDELVETGFGGRESDSVSEMVNELARIETDTDQMAADLTGELFSHEDTMKPVSVFLWYQIITKIADLADYAERVGNRIRLMLAR